MIARIAVDTPSASRRRGSWRGLLLPIMLVTAGLASAADAQPGTPSQTFPSAEASPDVQRLSAWIVTHGDAGGLPFLIVDKIDAMVFALDPHGRIVGSAPALLGLARGDDSPAGIGQRAIASITPGERITPAGRFVSGLGTEADGKDILWVNYADGIALHPVVTTKPAERRLERLASPTAADNRISYGCINVPPHFFDGIVVPLFSAAGGIVYILPETRSLDAEFFVAPILMNARPRSVVAAP